VDSADSASSVRKRPGRRGPSRVKTDPGSRRQVTVRGPILLWRDGTADRREGLVCLVSACPNPACACRDVWIDGVLIDDRAVAVSGGATSLRISWLAGSDPPATRSWPLRATVNIDRHTVTPRDDEVRADLVEWLRGELDEDLLTLLRARFRLAKR